MADEPTSLDAHRGLNAQKDTELRRRTAEVVADQAALRVRQADLEVRLADIPSSTWTEAAGKARYLLAILSQSPMTDPRHRKLIDAVLADFDRLLAAPERL